VTSSDLFASNGLVHIIDTVLLPPSIYDIGVEAGIFTTLLAAADAANLTDTFKGPGPLTLLAPTDEAFAKLPNGTVAALLNDIDALTSILLYHVISGDVRAETVVTLESATTLNGADVTIVVDDGMVKINDATVSAENARASYC
jgi:transforming growth factor-beta-induced protein